MIVLYGSTGQIGSEILKNFPKDVEIKCVPREEILNFESFISKEVDLVINCAAYTDVEKAESDRGDCNWLNFHFVATLVSCCSKFDVPLVHFSTDYVFDGSKSSPYVETDPTCPLNFYGESKANSESVCLTYDKAIVFRTSWVYSSHGRNFVRSFSERVLSGKPLSVVDDQIGVPNSAKQIALALATIYSNLVSERDWSSFSGIYHLSADGSCSWHHFSEIIKKSIASMFGLSVRDSWEVGRVKTESMNLKANRPRYSVLNSKKFESTFGFGLGNWDSFFLKDFDFEYFDGIGVDFSKMKRSMNV